MRKLSFLSGVFVVGALAIAACGGGTPATGGPALPSVAIPSLAIPSIVIPSNLLPSNLPIGSVAVPSIEANADPALAARFPTAIPGGTLGQPSTGRFMDVVNAFSEPEVKPNFTAAITAAGMDPNALTYGSQAVTMNENDVVQLQALRTGGVDGNKFVQIFPAIEKIIDPETEPDVLGQATVGGQTVPTLTDPSNGDVDYLFVTGDIVWRLTGADETEAATIISTLH
jgi:hypothetical protein